MTLSDALSEAVWDLAGKIKSLPRFEFIMEFVARQTRTKKGREAAGGFQLKKTRGGWVGIAPNGAVLYGPTKDASVLYDSIRRTPLNVYVQEAESLRADVLR